MNVLNEIQTKLKAPKNQRNAFGKYDYRSCEDILEALKPLLTEHGATVTLTDEIVQVGERYYVKATATLHADKDTSTVAYAREPYTKKGADESQITGAASSYARKYALNGLFCIDDNKDADSTNTHEHNTQNGPPRQRTNGAKKLSDEEFNQYYPSWAGQLQSGKRSVQDIIEAAKRNNINLTNEQVKSLEEAA